MSIWRWDDWAWQKSLAPRTRVSLGEGGTPLLKSRRLGARVGLRELYFKVETGNPAGSYKDRFAASAISSMLANGQTRCVATSSGNTGAALAAYSAAAGIRCHIAIVESAPESKLRQMMAYGANIVRVRGFGREPELTAATFAQLERLGAAEDAALQVSSYIYSEAGMRGVETIAFELAEQAGDSLRHVFCPAGGGGLCVALARGFAALRGNSAGRAAGHAAGPAVHCVQPEGNDTIAGPLRRGESRARPVESTTRISGLQVPNVNDGHLVINECRPTGGTGHLVTDEAVWDVQRLLAREEGIFCEPAGAVAVAGALQAARQGELAGEAPVVCLVTGTGFKDEQAVERMLAGDRCPTIELVDLEHAFTQGSA